MLEDDKEAMTDEEQTKAPVKRRSRIKIAVLITAIVLAVPASFAGYLYAASPNVIRNPKLEHYHFRMQIVVNGQAENFAEDKYQQDYVKDQCNANLPEQPIHFHDEKDQFTHIHWEGMTGGMVMKYYGWNYIGGIDKALGYKLDDLGDIQKVNTHGNFLPAVSEGTNFFVYTGDESNYEEKSFEDWKSLDLEEFFGTTSNSPAHELNKQSRLLNDLFPKALAHGGTEDGNDGEPGEESEEEKLTRINNLIGNVVIFAQNDKPSDQEVKDRFNSLEPLSDSTCGG